MKVHSISQIISVPLIVWLGYALYQMFFNHNGSELIILPAILLVVLYISYGYIDYWWMKKNTPEMDEKMKSWFVQNAEFYNKLTDENKRKFEKRMTLYVNAREFKSVGATELRDIPFDIKNILGSQGIRLTLGLEDYLIKNLDRIYTYKHPYPTPNKKFLHTVEVDNEDGVLILALDHALPGILNPYYHYNITLHGYVEAFVKMHNEIDWPLLNHYGWQRLELINGIFSDRIVKTLGYDEPNFLFYHIVAFFDFSEQYDKMFTEEYKLFAKIFNQDPANALS
jgi:hypothetical protein